MRDAMIFSLRSTTMRNVHAIFTLPSCSATLCFITVWHIIRTMVVGTTSYDSDIEPPTLAGARLDWKLPAHESLSDWTIVITSSTGASATYHVHKCMLAVGGKKSEYFGRLFQQDNFAEAKSSTSKINLEGVAAGSFPVLLDYLYSSSESSETLKLTTENAAALHYLGQYFGMRRIRWQAKQFWKKDLNVSNCAFYYAHSQLFHDKKLSEASVAVCVSGLKKITPDSEILGASDTQLWLDVSKKATRGLSQHLSSLIAKFCSVQHNLDKEDFMELSKNDCLPEIHFSVALQFLELEAKFAGLPQGTPKDADLSNLQERCILALSSRDFRSQIGLNDKSTQDCLAKQSSLFLARLMAVSATREASEAKTLNKKLCDETRMRVALERSLEATQSSLATSQSSLATARIDLAATKTSLTASQFSLATAQNNAASAENQMRRQNREYRRQNAKLKMFKRK